MCICGYVFDKYAVICAFVFDKYADICAFVHICWISVGALSHPPSCSVCSNLCKHFEYLTAFQKYSFCKANMFMCAKMLEDVWNFVQMWRLPYYTPPHVDTVSPSGWPYSKQPTRICGIPQIHNLLNPQILNFSKQVQPSKSNVQGKISADDPMNPPCNVFDYLKSFMFKLTFTNAMARIFYTAKKNKKSWLGSRRGLNSEGQLCLFSFDKICATDVLWSLCTWDWHPQNP